MSKRVPVWCAERITKTWFRVRNPFKSAAANAVSMTAATKPELLPWAGSVIYVGKLGRSDRMRLYAVASAVMLTLNSS